MRIILIAIFICLVSCSENVGTIKDKEIIKPLNNMQDKEIINPLYANVNPKDTTWLFPIITYAQLFGELTGMNYRIIPLIYNKDQDKYSLTFQIQFPDQAINNKLILDNAKENCSNFIGYNILGDSIHRFYETGIFLFTLDEKPVTDHVHDLSKFSSKGDILSIDHKLLVICGILPSKTKIIIDNGKGHIDVKIDENFIYLRPGFSLENHYKNVVYAVSAFVLKGHRRYYKSATVNLVDSLDRVKQTKEYLLIDGKPILK